MRDATKNVFISHVSEDDQHLRGLKSLLQGLGYNLRDSSIDSSKPNDATSPDYIKSGILAPRIRWAGTVLVLLSPNTHKSEWVNWEIGYAERQGKRIVGVWLHGCKDSDMPKNLDAYADSVVGWDGRQIIEAIEGEHNNSFGPDGLEREPREIARYSC